MALERKQFSHYLLLHLIGSGGMGQVYLAEDIQVRRQVAIKVIKIEAEQDSSGGVASTLRLFLREATVIAQLDHPNILPLYEHGEVRLANEHFAYLITPYRAEGSLINWLRLRAQVQQTRPLTLRQVAHLVQQAASALQYAHEHQVIHQDVKPANFLIRSKNETDEYPDLLLADFGIARLESATSSSSQNVRGTPSYMAPEQWSAQPLFASDQYALAVMTYELVTGSLPFQGPPMKMMYAHLHESPQSAHERNPLLSSAVDAVLFKALAKRPEERFPSVAAFAQAFSAAFAGVDERTTLRLLAPASTPPRTPDAPHTGDIHATLAISVEEAKNGASRALTLPGGRKVNIQVPREAQQNQVLILLGQGETLGSGHVGNLYLTLSIVETQPQGVLADIDAADTYRKTPVPMAAGEAATVYPEPQSAEPPPPMLPAQPVAAAHLAPPPQVTSPAKPGAMPSGAARDALQAGRDRGGDLTPPMGHLSESPRVPPRKISRRALLLASVVGVGAFAAWEIVSHQVSFGPISLTSTDLTNTPATAQTTMSDGLQNSGTTQNLFDVAWSGSQLVVVGDGGLILTSSNGHTWTPQPSGTSQALASVAWASSQFVAVGSNGTILTSPDGSTWTARPSGTTQNLFGVAGSGSQFVAVGGQFTTTVSISTILTSPDGSVWTTRPSGTASQGIGTLSGVVWSGSQFVVVGVGVVGGYTAVMILTSSDGDTWTPQPQPNGAGSELLYGVAWSGSQFVAVGTNGIIISSSDGYAWKVQSWGTYRDLSGVIWSGSQFVAVGQADTILTSPDGSSWTPQHFGLNADFAGVAWTGSRFVVVGAGGVIFTWL